MKTNKINIFFLSLLSLLPIMLEFLVKQIEALNSFATFVSLGVLALIILVVLLNLKTGLAQINLWFIERFLSLFYLVIVSLVSIERIFAMSISASSLIVTILALTLPIYFLVLITHFNFKNIFIGLLALLSLYLLNFSGFSLIILFNTAVAVSFYYIQTKISHEFSFRGATAAGLLLFFLIGIILTPILFAEFRFNFSTGTSINFGIGLLFIIIAVLLTKVSLKIYLNQVLIWKIAWLTINYFFVVQIVDLWTIDLLSAVLLILMTVGLVVQNGQVSKALPKLSIIVPTYNGAETISATFDSIRMQRYQNFEVIVVDDGSSDNTSDIVHVYQEKYPEFAMQYFVQKNADQLNAVKNALQYVTGQSIYILHSDDLFADQNVIYNGLTQLNHVNTDGVFIDLQQVNGMLEPLKKVWTKTFYKSQTNFAKLGLLFGRNPYVDFAFWQRNVFEQVVYQSYLTNNMVAWYDFIKNQPLNMRNGNFIGIKYRIHEGNYLNSADGAVNVLSGELRIMSHILSHLQIPVFKIQSLIYRAFNKFKLGDFIPVIAWSGQTNPAPIFENISSRRLENFDHPYIKAIIFFYRNRNSKKIIIEIPSELKIYHGSDIRLFNRALKEETLPDFYLDFMDKMGKGFDRIEVDKRDIDRLAAILEFFCIADFVKIEEKK